MADWNKSNRQDSWTSSVNRFCKYCKCWVSDNKISWAGHEQGARHKKAVEDKLVDMKRQAVMTQKNTQDERHFLQKMEEAALRDYKVKDVKTSRDFTAKLYNNESLPDIDEKYEPIQRGGAAASHQESQASGSGKPPDIGKMMYEKMAGKRKAVDPMLEPTGDEPDKWDKDYNEKTEAIFTPVQANAHGTRYHKESKTAKFWYEAKNDDGVSYYYNVTSGQSRWETPHNGFVSIAEQQELEDKKTEQTVKKMRVQAENKHFHGEHKRETEMLREMPDMSKHDPYGSGGWKKIEAEPTFSAGPQIDLGLPARREKQQPVIDKKEEKRIEFHEKTVASMSDKYGLVGGATEAPVTGEAESESQVQVSKPKISFRKRKVMSVRERTDDD